MYGFCAGDVQAGASALAWLDPCVCVVRLLPAQLPAFLGLRPRLLESCGLPWHGLGNVV